MVCALLHSNYDITHYIKILKSTFWVADIRTTPILLFVQPPRFYLYNPPFLIHTTPNLVQLLGTNIIILVGRRSL
jgi:hypothetical protein